MIHASLFFVFLRYPVVFFYVNLMLWCCALTNTQLVYKEAAVYPSFAAGYVSLLSFMMFGTVLLCPPAKWLLLTFGLLPSPGQGPSEADMDAGFLKVRAPSKGVLKYALYFSLLCSTLAYFVYFSSLILNLLLCRLCGRLWLLLVTCFTLSNRLLGTQLALEAVK